MNYIIDFLKQKKIFVSIIFFISLLFQIVFFQCFINKRNNHLVCTDSKEYTSIASNIYEGRGIKKLDGELNFRRLPGYPFFISTCYKLIGSDHIKIALWLQVFISSLIPILILILSLILFSQNYFLAKISSVFSLINLGFYLYSGMVLSDALFLFFYLIFLIAFFYKKHLFFCPTRKVNIGYFNLFISGLFLGVAGLIRPVGHYLLIVSILILVFLKLGRPEKIRNILSLFSGFFIISFGWILRNFLLTGFIFFHTLPGIHFLIYSAAYSDMETQRCSYPESRFKLLKKWESLSKENNLNDIESCYLAEKMAKKYIKKNPLAFVKHSIIHMFKTCFGLHSSRLLFLDSGKLPNYTNSTTLFDKIKRFLLPKTNNWALKIIIYLEIFLLLFFWIGFLGFCFKSFYNKKLLCILLKILPIFLCFIFITLAYGCARLRLSVEPFLIILSIRFWQTIFLKRRSNGTKEKGTF